MIKNRQTTLTDQNLDRLSNILQGNMNQPGLIDSIPDRAHIFHGSAVDQSLTEKNLSLASQILLGIVLGYVEEAPLIMVFERNKDQYEVVDLSNDPQKKEARSVKSLSR